MENRPRDVFDEVFGLLSPELLLQDPRANGEGVSLCVVDTGVERSMVEERARQRGQEIYPIQGGIFTRTQREPLPYDGHQSTPHGTTVADIILTLAPRVRLFSADIFGPKGSSDVETLLHALHWAINEWNCKILNLSLGITEDVLKVSRHRKEFLDAIEEAYFKDVLIFAAVANDHPLTLSYPAVLAVPLVSVDKRVFESPLEFAYALGTRVEFQAHSRGYLGPFAQKPATSWATPHLAAIAARLLSLRPGLKPFEIKTLLYWLSQKRVMNQTASNGA
jgi:subtilisin family serine protease